MKKIGIVAGLVLLLTMLTGCGMARACPPQAVQHATYDAEAPPLSTVAAADLSDPVATPTAVLPAHVMEYTQNTAERPLGDMAVPALGTTSEGRYVPATAVLSDIGDPMSCISDEAMNTEKTATDRASPFAIYNVIGATIIQNQHEPTTEARPNKVCVMMSAGEQFDFGGMYGDNRQAMMKQYEVPGATEQLIIGDIGDPVLAAEIFGAVVDHGQFAESNSTTTITNGGACHPGPFDLMSSGGLHNGGDTGTLWYPQPA